MKKEKIPTILAAIAVGAIALTYAATGTPTSGVTAADLSRKLSVVARMAGATEVSKQLLTPDLGKSVNAPLTEAGAVAILQKAGIVTTTSNPDRPLTSEQADALVRQYRSVLVTAAPRTGSTIRNSGLPDTVDTCFDEKNHGQCVKCCKALGGGASFCANACMVINKPSPSEPLP